MPEILSFGFSKLKRDGFIKSLWSFYSSQSSFIKFTLWILFCLAIVTPIITASYLIFRPKAQTATFIYSGVYIPEGQRDIAKILSFENDAKKGASIIHWYQGWGVTDGTQYFQPTWMNTVRNHGSIPMITWEPWNYADPNGINQPSYRLINIINGAFDPYIIKWAQDSKAWGYPYFLRFAHEMNTRTYPWSELVNGNQSGQYILAWKHIVDIFRAQGATNVTWVWSPNVEYAGTIPFPSIYPGDSYVDWLGMDGYNGGSALPWGGWQSFSQIFSVTYNHLIQVAPTKPIMVSETASAEAGGSKAAWITDAFQTQLTTNFPKIKAALWFNQNNAWETDWRIESSLTAQNAYVTSIASSFYKANEFSYLNTSPIPAPENLYSPPTPTPTPVQVLTPTPTPTIGVPLPTATSVPGTKDTVAPNVVITLPTAGATVMGKVQIVASASDNIGVTKVVFYVDNRLLATDYSSPYIAYWQTRKAAFGVHKIRATAYDAAGNSASSEIAVTSN